VLLDVPNNFASFKEVQDLFELGWKGDDAIPSIHKIWKIYGEKGLNFDWNRYKRVVEQQSKVLGGNVQKRFYGAEKACNVGDDERNRELCYNSPCTLCQTIRTFFGTAQAGWFGQGIYTMTTSSGADEHVKTSSNSQFKAVLLNDVILGNVKELEENDPQITRAPSGYDSVVNKFTTIVYSKSATRPIYLVIYS